MNQVFSILGWTFLPSYATSTLQSIYYKVTIPVGSVPPQPGTPVYAKHHYRIRVFVLTLYLLYTLLQSLYDIKLAGDFFTLLSINPSTPDREIKTRFRRLAAKYHPDKLHATETGDGSTNNNNNVPTNHSDMHFLLLKTAQDTLLSPSLRYAYTRFGPSITHIQSPTTPTIQNYVLAGLRHNLLPSYIIKTAWLVVMNYLFLPKWGSYWRYLTLASIVVLEWCFLTHSDTELSRLLPSFIPITQIYTLVLSKTKLNQILPPHLLPYQMLIVLRELSMSLNIFISQLAPSHLSLSNTAQSLSSTSSVTPIISRINQNLSHVHQTALHTDAESTSLLRLQMAPFKGDEAQVRDLREGMAEGIVTAMVRQNAEVREAVARVLERRNQEGRMRRTTEAGRRMDNGI